MAGRNVAAASTKLEESTMPTASRRWNAAALPAAVKEDADISVQPVKIIEESSIQSPFAKLSSEGPHDQTETARVPQSARTLDGIGEAALEGLAHVVTRMTRDFSRLLAQHTVVAARAAHRANLEGVADELVNVHLPKLVNEKMLPMREAFAGMLSKLSNDVEAQAFPDVRAEVRAVAKEFIWADIKKTTEVKTLEDRLDKLEGRVTDLANENAALKQGHGDVDKSDALKQSNSRLEGKLDQLEKGNMALRSRVLTIETTNIAARQQMTAMQQDFETLAGVVQELVRRSNVWRRYINIHHDALGTYLHAAESAAPPVHPEH